MGKINIARVLLGGLLAGFIINLFEYVTNGVVFAAQWDAYEKAVGRQNASWGHPFLHISAFVAGIAARAQALADSLENRFPQNTELNNYWLPSIRAAIQLKRGKSAEALKILEVAVPYELGYPRPQLEGGSLIYPAYLRGQAYLLLHRGSEAAREFQKFVDQRAVVVNCPLGALAHLWLGRAQALEGNADAARQSYQKFFKVWKDADPDIPILKQAKAEYAKLK